MKNRVEGSRAEKNNNFQKKKKNFQLLKRNSLKDLFEVFR
jgi:hypothetical protein